MKIVSVQELIFPEVRVIRYKRFADERGFFSETYKKSDFQTNPLLSFLKDFDFVQANTSFSKKGVIRGLHVQWNPYMGKLVKVITGRMIDLFMDIRKNSHNFGKIAAYDMNPGQEKDYNEWIWLPVGFAHGSCFLEDSYIEYFCTGEYNPSSEAGISPLGNDIDWSLCDKNLKKMFDEVVWADAIISEKDKKGYTIASWRDGADSEYFK